MAFEAYVDHVLAPSLRPGQVVVLDNLSVHKGERVRQAIEARGCQVLFRPSYSPDVTPIEEAFSKLKAWLRRLGARTRERLEEAIARHSRRSPRRMPTAGFGTVAICRRTRQEEIWGGARVMAQLFSVSL